MLTLSVAMPVLERAEAVKGPIAESEHNPTTCPSGHDHTVCTQVDANEAAQSHGHPRRIAAVSFSDKPSPRAQAYHSAVFATGHPSRAPPLV